MTEKLYTPQDEIDGLKIVLAQERGRLNAQQEMLNTLHKERDSYRALAILLAEQFVKEANNADEYYG